MLSSLRFEKTAGPEIPDRKGIDVISEWIALGGYDFDQQSPGDFAVDLS